MMSRRLRPSLLLAGGAFAVAAAFSMTRAGHRGRETRAASSTPATQDASGPTRIGAPEGLAVPTPLEDPSGHALDRFHAALFRAERAEGKARVLVYGASHAAADHLPGHLRHDLQDRFGDGGRGFTLPAWPSDRYPYWTWGATVDEGIGWERVRLGIMRGEPDYYGIAGIVFDSGGREAIARVTTAEEGVGSAADSIVVLYEAMPGGGVFDVWIDGALTQSVDTEASEVRAGQVDFDVEDGPHVVELRTRSGAPVRVYGIAFERSAPGVIVDNVALTGARARYHEKWLDPVYTEQLRARDPDLLLLWYGGNEGNDLLQTADATAREIRRALSKLRTAVPDASCVVLGPSDKPIERDGEWTLRARTASITRASRTIAFEHGCAFFDTVAFMGGAGSMVLWVDADPPLARDDYIHFSALGYRLLADELLGDLLGGYEPRR